MCQPFLSVKKKKNPGVHWETTLLRAICLYIIQVEYIEFSCGYFYGCLHRWLLSLTTVDKW